MAIIGDKHGLPPYSQEAEASVIGAILLEPDIFPEIYQILPSSNMFFMMAHQLIYESMITLYQAGVPIDIVTITDDLTKSDHIRRVGGPVVIYNLSMSTPTSSHGVYYARIVLDKAILRQLILEAKNIIQAAYDNGDEASEVISMAKDRIYNLSLGQTSDEYLSDLRAEVIKLKDANMVEENIPTGLATLDASLGGGIKKTELTVIGGRPKRGKSALAMQILTNMALNLGKDEGDVLIFSVEMSARMLAQRYVASKTRTPVQKIRLGEFQFDPEWWDAPKALERLKIYDKSIMTIDDIISTTRSFHRKSPISVVVVDHIHRLSDRNKSAEESEVTFLGRIAKELHNLARDLKIAVIGLSQLSRDADRGHVDLKHLRGSGEIEQVADVVVMLEELTTIQSKPAKPDPSGKGQSGIIDTIENKIILIKIKKGRNIPESSFPFILEGAYMTFREPLPEEMAKALLASGGDLGQDASAKDNESLLAKGLKSKTKGKKIGPIGPIDPFEEILDSGAGTTEEVIDPDELPF